MKSAVPIWAKRHLLSTQSRKFCDQRRSDRFAQQAESGRRQLLYGQEVGMDATTVKLAFSLTAVFIAIVLHAKLLTAMRRICAATIPPNGRGACRSIRCVISTRSEPFFAFSVSLERYRFFVCGPSRYRLILAVSGNGRAI